MVNNNALAWTDRYSRQTRFAPIGEAGQTKLGHAIVLIVGVGALGASLAQHMVRAGVGEVRLVDRDYVEPSNLQRQMLFDEADALAMLPKAVAAAERLCKINSEIRITASVIDVHENTVQSITAGAHLVLDGTDNTATRLLLSDQCFFQDIPFIYGGIAGSQGMSAALIPGQTTCLRCLIGASETEVEADTCDTVGVLSPAVEFVAALQAAEAIKWLSGNKSAIRQTMVSLDLWSFKLREAKLPSGSTACNYCGQEQKGSVNSQVPSVIKAASTAVDTISFAKALAEAQVDEVGSVVLCGRNSVQVTLAEPLHLEKQEKRLAAKGCSLTVNRYLVKAVLPSGEQLVLFPDGRVLVQGTSDREKAVLLCRTYLLT